MNGCFPFIVFVRMANHDITDMPANLERAIIYGDLVKAHFYCVNGRLTMAEEVYFFLMASMRKMRMQIPLTYTLEYFQDRLHQRIQQENLQFAILTVMAYRVPGTGAMAKYPVGINILPSAEKNIFEINEAIEVDVLKEISVNTNLLSHLQIHHPENIYAEIYAAENGLDDLILINPNRRIARSIFGNYLFLEGEVVRIPKQSEGACISPLLENFVTWLHKNRKAEIVEAEINPFESQKAEEILIISDERGFFPVRKIRNRTFSSTRFEVLIKEWAAFVEN